MSRNNNKNEKSSTSKFFWVKKPTVDSILDDLDDSRTSKVEGIPSYETLEDDYLASWRFLDVGVMQVERPDIEEHQPETFYKNMGLAK